MTQRGRKVSEMVKSARVSEVRSQSKQGGKVSEVAKSAQSQPCEKVSRSQRGRKVSEVVKSARVSECIKSARWKSQHESAR